MQWITPREKSPFVSKSADGYYAVAWLPLAGEFEAYHIEALWASPTSIGRTLTLTEAQAISEQHAERTPAPV